MKAMISATSNQCVYIRQNMRRAKERVYKEQFVKKEEGVSICMTVLLSWPLIQHTGKCNHRCGLEACRLPESWRKAVNTRNDGSLHYVS